MTNARYVASGIGLVVTLNAANITTVAMGG